MANNFNKAKETIVWITEVLYIRFPRKNVAHFSPGNGYIGTLPNQNYRGREESEYSDYSDYSDHSEYSE